MKKLIMILSMALILCFMVGYQDNELEDSRSKGQRKDFPTHRRIESELGLEFLSFELALSLSED